MPRNKDIKKVLLIGSGPIVIGQAAEFDYAGTQALTTLKNEGLEVVLVNSNPATIMTDAEMADRVIVMNKSAVAMNGTVDEVYSRGDELRAMGLNVPEITEIFAKLRSKGIDLPENVYTVEQGATILRNLIERRGNV